MIRTVFALAAALMFASPALADDASGDAPPAPPACIKDGATVPAENIALAQNIMTVTKTTDRISFMLDALMPVMMDMLHKSEPDLSNDMIVEIRAALRDEMEKSVPSFLAAEACVYAQHFTADDMKAMIAFYTSPVGTRFLAATPDIAKQSMAIGQAWGEQSGRAALTRVLSKLKKPGDKT
jgi:uncharacterized protein